MKIMVGNNNNKLYYFKQNIKNKLLFYHANINWCVFLFIVVFTIGSWLDLNGMWCELPLMVHELPEGWRLPSILGAIIQFSQLGSLLFFIFKYSLSKNFSLVLVIYCIFAIGALSCLPLAFLWNKTVNVGNEKRSIPLYILTFTLGVLDGTSSLTFLPYIGHYFKKEYIIPNYVGESLSSMIPGLLGIIQGVGKDPGCTEIQLNLTNNTMAIHMTGLINVTYANKTRHFMQLPLKPTFSVSVYFILLFFILLLSVVAFTFLHYLPVSRRSRKIELVMSANGGIAYNSVLTNTSTTQHHHKPDYDRLSYTSLSSLIEEQSLRIEPIVQTIDGPNNIYSVRSTIPTRQDQIFLLAINCVTTFFVYGFLPSIQSYFTLPYGRDVYHMCINLGNLLLPISIMFSIISYRLTPMRIFIEFLIGLILSIYVILIASTSPCPPLLHSRLGSFLVVFSWVTIVSLFTRVRCCIAAQLEVCGQHILYLFGIVTIIGQMSGGFLAYLLIEVYRLFNDLPNCVNAQEFCSKTFK